MRLTILHFTALPIATFILLCSVPLQLFTTPLLFLNEMVTGCCVDTIRYIIWGERDADEKDPDGKNAGKKNADENNGGENNAGEKKAGKKKLVENTVGEGSSKQ